MSLHSDIERYTSSDYNEIADVWEASVRSSHHFLTENDIAFYKPLVINRYLPAVELYVMRENGKIVAFIGLAGDNIEMLFVRPDKQGKGYGTALVDYAIKSKGIRKVDVNEQNEIALHFYLAKASPLRQETKPMPKARRSPYSTWKCANPKQKPLKKRSNQSFDNLHHCMGILHMP